MLHASRYDHGLAADSGQGEASLSALGTSRGTAFRGPEAYVSGFTGLGVCATRFAAVVMLGARVGESAQGCVDRRTRRRWSRILTRTAPGAES